MPDTFHPTMSARLTALRAELRAENLDALIVPRFDAHQGEYIAPHDARLAYMTGFTGSAGVAIITLEGAAVFADGRYSVQLGRECDEALFERLHIFKEPPEHWIANLTQHGWKIGFDAMHVPPAWLDRFQNAVAASGGECIATKDNLVDRIWADQPAPPTGAISAFPLQFAGRTPSEKRDQILEMVAASGFDLLVETQPDNLCWLLNVRGEDVDYNPMPQSFLILARNGEAQWFVNADQFEAGLAEKLPDWLQIAPRAAFLSDLSDALGHGKRVIFDPDFSPVAVRTAIEQSKGRALAQRSPMTLVKTEKNPSELAGMRSCHLADGAAWSTFAAWLSREIPARATAGNPVTEFEAEEQIHTFRKAQPGFISDSFRSISAAAGNASMCHYAAPLQGSSGILPDNPYLLDSGGQYETGTTDATRSFAFGPVSDHYRTAYTCVVKSLFALATLRFPPGTQGHHIDAICRRPLWDMGLDYDHGTGHGVGHRLSVHEHPQRIGKPYSPVDLKPGMVMSIEPGFYETDQFGIRVENLYEIKARDDGFMEFDVISFIPIQTDMLDLSRMTDAEIDWLNAYHAEVVKRIGPRLGVQDAEWLTTACAPINRP